MEENRYPSFEEETSGIVAAEPVAGAEYAYPSVAKNTSGMPTGVPCTTEMAIADIEEGERQFERGETYTHKELMQMVWSKINSYAG